MSVHIEQAIARGLTATRISVLLDVDLDLVHTVWDRMDELAADPVDEPPTYSRALARERGIVAGNAAKALAARSLLEQVVDAPRGPRCGTAAEFVRHHRKREPIDPLCRLAWRTTHSEQRRQLRARQRALVAA